MEIVRTRVYLRLVDLVSKGRFPCDSDGRVLLNLRPVTRETFVKGTGIDLPSVHVIVFINSPFFTCSSGLVFFHKLTHGKIP